MRLERVAGFLVGLWILCGSAAWASQGFPVGDGFVYPGQPGSEGISTYYKMLGAPAPRRPAGRLPEYAQVAWLVGRWTVDLRDYDYTPPGAGHIQQVASGTADIAFTSDQWWIQIDITLPNSKDLWFLGYDYAAGRWVLHKVGKPGGAYNSAVFATAWKADRITFEPTELINGSGVKLFDRLTIVREAADRFRIVTEAQMPTGRFVAVHDRLFTRTSTRTR